MDSLFQALEWFFAAGQAVSCLALVYGAYLSLRHVSLPLTENRTDSEAAPSLPAHRLVG